MKLCKNFISPILVKSLIFLAKVYYKKLKATFKCLILQEPGQPWENCATILRS